jgi:hypothetical protein
VPPYQELFPKGSKVRVKDRATLEAFKVEWRWHHPLEGSQLDFAGESGRVASIGFYHGGDVVYWLDGIPGVWHERFLEVLGAEERDSG